MIRRLLVPLATVFVFSSLACQSQAAGGATKPARHFTIETAAAELSVGQPGTLRVTVKPTSGYKWNLEYPTKLRLEKAETERLRFPKTQVRRGDPEISTSGKDATLSVPVEAKASGAEKVSAKLSFSVCTDKSCHVYRDEPIEVSVTVR